MVHRDAPDGRPKTKEPMRVKKKIRTKHGTSKKQKKKEEEKELQSDIGCIQVCLFFLLYPISRENPVEKKNIYTSGAK